MNMKLTGGYSIPNNISVGYSIQDRIYHGQLFISSKNILVQHTKEVFWHQPPTWALLAKTKELGPVGGPPEILDGIAFYDSRQVFVVSYDK